MIQCSEKPLDYLLDKLNLKNFETVLSSKEPLVSIVMLNWLRWDVFMGTLNHILSKKNIPLNLSLTVQACKDNIKKEQVLEKIKKFDGYSVKFTRANNGTGYPRYEALHRAIDKFDTPYIHFTDDDMRLPRFAIELMVSLLESNSELGAVNMITHPNSNVWSINSNDVLRCRKPDMSKTINESLALGSATMVVRKEVFDTCDYDYEYKIGCADIDLGMQMTKNGWKCAMITIPNWYAVNVKGGDENYRSVRYDMNIVSRSIERFNKKWGYRL